MMDEIEREKAGDTSANAPASEGGETITEPADISRPFTLMIDEAYDFINQDVEILIDQARERGLRLLFAPRRLAQLARTGEQSK